MAYYYSIRSYIYLIVYLQMKCHYILQLYTKPTTNPSQGTQAKQNYNFCFSNNIISLIRRRILISTKLIVILVSICIFLKTRNQDFCTCYLYQIIFSSILQSTLRNALKAKLVIIQQLYLQISLRNDRLQYLYKTQLQPKNWLYYSYYI